MASSTFKRSDPLVWWVTLGVGFLPKAPGTWGSLLAVVLWWFVLAPLSLPLQALVIAVYFGVSTLITHHVMRRYDVHDAPEIIADEVAGMWIVLLAAPQVWWVVLAGFVLFRVLDIAKPWPIGWADRSIPGALGVMLDDVLAGFVGLAVLQLSFWLI